MFGLNEQEMDLYKDLAQDFAVRDVAPKVVSNSRFITPLVEGEGGKDTPDVLFIRQLLTDIETIITITASHMAYEYAHLQCESEQPEEEVVRILHTKYEDHLVSQFIKYGIAFTQGILKEIIGDIILELPYLYMTVIEDKDFNADDFLEEKLEAYNKYLDENFSEVEDEEGEE
jgi:hypothetical protein